MGEKHWKELRDDSFQEYLRGRAETKKVKAVTPNHQVYLDAIESKKAVICTGPAGSGKTWQACGKAVEMLRSGRVPRIILSRPLQECDEEIGFLPGGLDEKVADMMVPLTDALDEFLEPGELERMRADGRVVIVPLAKMRGRTMKNSFVILDEAQNSSFRQLHMFLTRFGNKCKMIVCGDHTQSDLPYKGRNSLREMVLRFNSEPNDDVAVVELTSEDIVRDELVKWFDKVMTKPFDPSWDTPETDDGMDVIDCPGCGHEVWYERWADDGETLIECPHCDESVELRDEIGRLNPAVVEPDGPRVAGLGQSSRRPCSIR